MSTDRYQAQCLEWKPIEKNTLRGFAKILFPSGIAFSEITVHQKNGRAWASPPSRQRVDRDGVAQRDEAGKYRWDILISFSTREARDRWSAAVLEAVKRDYPDALGE